MHIPRTLFYLLGKYVQYLQDVQFDQFLKVSDRNRFASIFNKIIASQSIEPMDKICMRVVDRNRF